MVWRSRPLRVAMFGAMGVIVQTIVFEVLGIWLGLVRPSTANIFGSEMGVLTAFVLNNRFSFNDRSHAPLLHRLLRFHIVVSGSLVIQWFCIYTTESWTDNFYIIHLAYAVGILVGFVFNYTGYRLWVWRHHEAPDM